ncbi:uncharacterized protein LOC122510588 [Leptopilina heterotoma]|uniref:uncharacterized protein LOC122510588 n=1 Tax=Leptopilina heterotoma TaxID=63436 RepID=UPI001CA9BCB9|nr:uncharacterized protein LOC122510588 [Leptopilina heterotoma]
MTQDIRHYATISMLTAGLGAGYQKSANYMDHISERTKRKIKRLLKGNFQNISQEFPQKHYFIRVGNSVQRLATAIEIEGLRVAEGSIDEGTLMFEHESADSCSDKLHVLGLVDNYPLIDTVGIMDMFCRPCSSSGALHYRTTKTARIASEKSFSGFTRQAHGVG